MCSLGAELCLSFSARVLDSFLAGRQTPSSVRDCLHCLHLLCCLSPWFALPGRALIKPLALSLLRYWAPAVLSQYSENLFLEKMSSSIFPRFLLCGEKKEWQPLLQERSF